MVVRIAESSTDSKGTSDKIQEALTAALGAGTFDIRRVEFVGPKVGKDLTKKALLAIFFSWVGMLVYIALRFEFRYGVGGILALVHDTIITIGAMSLLDKEFDLTIVAALLHDHRLFHQRHHRRLRPDPGECRKNIKQDWPR